MTDQQNSDFSGIDSLHKKDVDASKIGDFETLRSLIDDEGVLLPPGGPSIRGKEALDKAFEIMRSQFIDIEILEYCQDFKETIVLDDYAIEWGIAWGSSRIKKDGKIQKEKQQLMRILKKQQDGSWKVYASIWNDVPLDTK
jgi:ketosteroid isomerase-like protein